MSRIHDKLKKINDNKIRIYPTIRKYKFAVCIEDDYNAVYKKQKTVGEYKHTSKTINKALEDAIDYIYKRLTHIQ